MQGFGAFQCRDSMPGFECPQSISRHFENVYVLLQQQVYWAIWRGARATWREGLLQNVFIKQHLLGFSKHVWIWIFWTLLSEWEHTVIDRLDLPSNYLHICSPPKIGLWEERIRMTTGVDHPKICLYYMVAQHKEDDSNFRVCSSVDIATMSTEHLCNKLECLLPAAGCPCVHISTLVISTTHACFTMSVP